jgi:phosphoribosylformimino-5-aminoimidazole carboxamide ribotide isomerase
MKIVPVIDVMNGQVVHGVGGQRADYRPVKSRLTSSSQPVDVADALHRHFAFTTFYVADLDAIAGVEPAFSLYANLARSGLQLWIDAGIAVADQALALANKGAARIVAGLETLKGPDVLTAISRQLGERTIFSLDLRSGRPLCPDGSWKVETWEVLDQAIQAGVRAILLLDLARVGMRSGTGTEELASRLSANYPEVQIIAGGGIRNVDDLHRLDQCGVGTALMATALHDGSITPTDLEGIAIY